MKKRKKLGLALGSGGGRGLTHIGVLKSLKKHGVEVNYIAGASIGSLIGAMYCAGIDPDEIQERLLDNKWESFATFLDPTFFTGGAVSGEKLQKLIAKLVGTTNFSKLKIPLSTVSSDLISGEEVRISKGDLALAVRASMSVPSVFKPVKYRKHLLVDGGVINPVPVSVVKKMGADVVLAVNLDSRKKSGNEKKTHHFMSQVVVRTLNIVRHYLAEYSLKDVDIVLNPQYRDDGMISLNLFADKDLAMKAIKQGERMMDRRINDLLKLL